MRFTTALLAGALAAIASAQSGSATLNPVQASQAACLDDCEDGDVKCQSYCITVSLGSASYIATRPLYTSSN